MASLVNDHHAPRRQQYPPRHADRQEFRCRIFITLPLHDSKENLLADCGVSGVHTQGSYRRQPRWSRPGGVKSTIDGLLLCMNIHTIHLVTGIVGSVSVCICSRDWTKTMIVLPVGDPRRLHPVPCRHWSSLLHLSTFASASSLQRLHPLQRSQYGVTITSHRTLRIALRHDHSSLTLLLPLGLQPVSGSARVFTLPHAGIPDCHKSLAIPMRVSTLVCLVRER